jgi:hypothetical protein
MEHTLNPQGITVNGKSRQIKADGGTLNEIQKREEDQKRWRAARRRRAGY